MLSIDLLRALQDKCDAGPPYVLARLRTGQWYVDDIIHTIRFGLEGGGLPKEEARRLNRLHVEDQPLSESVLTAQLVLANAIYGGIEDDASGEAQAAAMM